MKRRLLSLVCTRVCPHPRHPSRYPKPARPVALSSCQPDLYADLAAYPRPSAPRLRRGTHQIGCTRPSTYPRQAPLSSGVEITQRYWYRREHSWNARPKVRNRNATETTDDGRCTSTLPRLPASRGPILRAGVPSASPSAARIGPVPRRRRSISGSLILMYRPSPHTAQIKEARISRHHY